MTEREISEWTATRQHFQEFKTYTKLHQGSVAWINFWKEERRRCLEGYHIGSDYIPGYFYDYLNFSPIMISQAIEGIESDTQVQANRIEGFPDFWDGDYDFFHYIDDAEKGGKHASLAGSRGKGKSFKAGAMLNRNYYHIEKSKSFAFAYSLEFLTSDGIITKAWDIMDFRDQYTPWGKRRQFKNTDLHRRASFQETDAEGLKIEKGWKSEIIGVTVGDDINKLRGKRGKLIILEEAGNFRNLNKGINILRPSMEDGKNTFGLILTIGTGGSEGISSEGFEEIFRNPKGYNIHAVKNVWEPGRENTMCGFFWSAAKNFKGFYDVKTGVSDQQGATDFIMADRAVVATGSDPHALTRRKAELPLTPSEMLMRISGTQFPIGLLKEQEAEIETKRHLYRDADFICKMVLNTETNKFEAVPDFDAIPIYKFPHSAAEKPEGAPVIYEHPAEDKPPFGRYVAGIDSYDFDESTTNSLGSMYIADTYTKRIVAEYTGRPEFSTDFYETCRRMLLYYNAQANIENSNKGIFDYFDAKNSGWLICDVLNIVTETMSHDNKGKQSTRKKGTTPNPLINARARGMIAEYLKTRTENNEDNPEEMFIHKFKSLAAIKEMILWNIDGNFDRVSALGMLMLIMNDKLKYVDEMRMGEEPKLDSFFTRHVGKQFSHKEGNNNIDFFRGLL